MTHTHASVHVSHQRNPRIAAEEQRLLEQKKSNPLRSYLGLSDEEQKRIEKRDALIDRDLYSDLRRCAGLCMRGPGWEEGGG